MTKPELWIVGTPLDEPEALSPRAAAVLSSVQILVGESRPVTERYLKKAGIPFPDMHYLDPFRAPEWKALQQALADLAKKGGKAALLSDVGMPILFDPGSEVLEFCRTHGYTVRSVPSATSWGSAAALSGYPPPFEVTGFPPRPGAERDRFFSVLKKGDSHRVLMDTPYRFRLLCKELAAALPSDGEVFLAWELGKANEKLLWFKKTGLVAETTALGLEKGEFVFIVRGSHFIGK